MPAAVRRPERSASVPPTHQPGSPTPPAPMNIALTAAGIFFVGLTAAELAFFLGGSAVLWPAFAAMVFCQGGKTTVVRAWATELFPTSVRGAAAGWITAAGMVGGTCGLAIAGALAPRVGGIGPALAVIASAGVLAAIAAFLWLPETKGRELEAIAPEVA